MTKFIKSILILSIWICALFTCEQVIYADTTEIDGVNYRYTIENETVSITSATPVSNYDVVVPESINGYPVTSVAGFGLTDIKTVILPDTVTSLGSFAFKYCENLTRVTLSQNITTIKTNTFTNCKKLKKINIPAKVTTIENSAFNYCEDLDEISLSENITHIGNSAFYACKSLKSIDFPNGLTHIGENAFFNCRQLQTVLIPKTISSIGTKAFAQSSRDDMGTLTPYLTDRTFDNICYTGSEEEWKQISIGNYNTNLTNSTIKFNVPTCFVKINHLKKNTEVFVTPENMDNCLTVVGAYKNGIASYITTIPISENTFWIPNSTDFDSIKVFVFDSFTSLKPMCSHVKRSFNLK